MALRPIYLSFIKRNSPLRGPTSSEAWNDSLDELAQDLSGIYTEWNNSLYPLLNTLPNGVIDVDVDAFANGLDGDTLYADSRATILDASYWNSTKNRPNTVLEQLENLYTQLATSVSTLENAVSTVTVSANQVSVTDTGEYYAATNVETSLQELGSLLKTGGILGLKVTPSATTPVNLTLVDANVLHTNEGATTQIIFNLPYASSNGYVFKFYVQDSDGLRINASTGDTIRIGTAVSTVGGYIESTDVGSAITLVSINDIEWVALTSMGTWTASV